MKLIIDPAQSVIFLLLLFAWIRWCTCSHYK